MADCWEGPTVVAGTFCARCGATARRPGYPLWHTPACLAGVPRPPHSTLQLEVGVRASAACRHEDQARRHGPDATAFLLGLRQVGDLYLEGPRS